MDFKKSQTIYMQIADFICENILSEKIKAGDKIQSVREMAETTQVNPNTIMRTYSYLQEQEIIYNKRGIGYFVADDAPKKMLNIRRKEFIQNELPEFFKSMDVLGIDFDDLQKIYQEQRNGNHWLFFDRIWISK